MANSRFEDYKRFPLGLPIAGSICDPKSRGYIYVIGFAEPGIVKIGSAKAPNQRLADLQCGNPFELKVKALVSVYSGNPVNVEFAAHRIASDHHIRGEWFELSEDEALRAVLKAARDKKVRHGAYAAAYENDQLAWEENRVMRLEAERKALCRKLGIDA
jgi:hypothetical protein